MATHWDWKVTKTSFSRLEIELRQLATQEYEVYQIVAVEEVKPARAPFEVVIVSRRLVQQEPVESTTPTFSMNYSPP
jgi:hypothetical protein